MKKQRRIIIGLSLIIGLMVGGTSAYFVTQTTTHNVISMSGIGVEIIETSIGDDGEEKPFQNIENALPGETYSKIPKVRSIDEGEVWVRMIVSQTATLDDGTVVVLSGADAMTLDYNLTNWTIGEDGNYYYNDALNNGEETVPLFTEVTVPSDLDNTYGNATFSLTVTAEAVQVANNGATVMEAEGWPEE